MKKIILLIILAFEILTLNAQKQKRIRYHYKIDPFFEKSELLFHLDTLLQNQLTELKGARVTSDTNSDYSVEIIYKLTNVDKTTYQRVSPEATSNYQNERFFFYTL